MEKLIFVALSFAAFSAWGVAPVHRLTDEENQKMVEHNAEKAANDFINFLFEPTDQQSADVEIQRVPFAEYNSVGYVLFNDIGHFNSLEAKKTIARNLPKDVVLVVFTGQKEKQAQQEIFDLFANEIRAERLKVVYLADGDWGFWARDGIPVPVWTLDSFGNKKFSVVDAKYHKPFEPDKRVSELFAAEYIQHEYYHEGGNFLANNRGDCLVVDNERAEKISDLVFKQMYGCAKTIRFPYTKGIGHIDETVKLINDNLAITDDEEYATILRANHFLVQMVPRPQNKYETYVNSLAVNGTLFLPVFSQGGDQAAIQLYERLGYKVIPLDSRSLSNEGYGSIHCITMAYPPVAFRQLLAQVGGTDVSPKRK